nr:hypothetical protein [Desulfobacter vibrioformis]
MTGTAAWGRDGWLAITLSRANRTASAMSCLPMPLPRALGSTMSHLSWAVVSSCLTTATDPANSPWVSAIQRRSFSDKCSINPAIPLAT